MEPRHTAARYTYRLQVDPTTADWNPAAIDVPALVASPYNVAVLAEGTGYAWRVVTYDADLDNVTALAGTTMSFTTPVTFATSGTTAAPLPVLSWPSGGPICLHAHGDAFVLRHHVGGGAHLRCALPQHHRQRGLSDRGRRERRCGAGYRVDGDAVRDALAHRRQDVRLVGTGVQDVEWPVLGLGN